MTRDPASVNRPIEEPITKLDDVRAAHNVVAAVADLDTARSALLALERAGVPMESLALLGARPDPDGGSAAPLGGRLAATAGAGAVAGSAIGALVALTVPGIGPAVGAGMWAAAGATAGGVVGGMSGISGSEAWRHTFEAVDAGNVAVGVHSEDPDVAAVAFDALSEFGVLAINRFDD